MRDDRFPNLLSRRDVLRTGMVGLGATLLGPLGAPPARAAAKERILVVVELSGGNDGLNTVVPYGDDAYYRLRPELGILPSQLRKIDLHFGFSEGMAGFERLYQDGRLAIVHGCGYPQPSFSHFTSMAYWHTAAPNSGEAYGWLGRLADAMRPEGSSDYIVNIDRSQSLAVRSRNHTPLVFDDPNRLVRKGFHSERGLLGYLPDSSSANGARRYLQDIARGARASAQAVREAWNAYRTPVDYGLAPLDLPKVAALIAAGMSTRLYYTAFRNNAFDTHVHQSNLHARLLTYASDAITAFIYDLERIGRASDVAILIFSEFGRRAPENTSLGTDHGAAGLMFVAGYGVRGGHHGVPPSLTELDHGDNLIFTTDFRRVYASVVEGWLGYSKTAELLNGEFEPLELFA
ncbi:MAG: DUF1501 domain-containing protein [Myxococcota bacterium]